AALQEPEATLASAEIKRQKRGSVAEIDRMLAGIDHPEALYVRGMVRWRDGKLGEAMVLFNQTLDAQARIGGGPHNRARYRLAVIALTQNQKEAAKAHL